MGVLKVHQIGGQSLEVHQRPFHSSLIKIFIHTNGTMTSEMTMLASFMDQYKRNNNTKVCVIFLLALILYQSSPHFLIDFSYVCYLSQPISLLFSLNPLFHVEVLVVQIGIQFIFLFPCLLLYPSQLKVITCKIMIVLRKLIYEQI